MQNLTVATFNCENLFIRYKFFDKIKPAKKEDVMKNGFVIDTKVFQRILDKARDLTAMAIRDTKADIIALQEIENLDTLKSFQSQYVKKYPFQYLIDGNDPRFIDVGVLSKMQPDILVTHQFDKNAKHQKIFSRDCLEIEFNIQKTPLTLFVNHFKSMLGSRDDTMERRKEQAERVVELVKAKFGSNPGKENFIILGDFNDYMPSSGLEPLVGQSWIENVIATRLPKEESWTHWYDKENSVSQLDYILLSKRIAEASPNTVPTIIRKGLGKKATAYTGPRYPGVGPSAPSASDHCPAAISINLK